MLKATTDLIENIHSRRPGSFSASVITKASVAVVARHGRLEDADVLLDLFLEDPTDYWRAELLDAVMRVGNVDNADKLAAACLAKGELKEGTQSAVLHALGFLGYSKAREVLWRYAQDKAPISLKEAPISTAPRSIGRRPIKMTRSLVTSSQTHGSAMACIH